MAVRQKTSTRNAKNERKIVCVFQGGGALGPFQSGAYQALNDYNYCPDMLIGISIGSINAAIIAGNPPQQRLEKLKYFWNKVSAPISFPNIPFAGMAKFHNFWGAQYAMTFGQPGFFIPRAINPLLLTNADPEELSFYDPAPLRDTLLEVIDFDYLNAGHIRLCIGATDLSSGDFVFFENFKDTLTPEHIMASGALPPGFPAVKIDGRYYIDGGVHNNNPLVRLLEEFAKRENEIHNVLCFMVDLFSISGPIPHSLDGMLERIKDIQYSSRSKRSSAIYATTQNLSHAIRFLTTKLSDQAKEDPKVKEITKLGYANRLDLVHIIYHSVRGTELQSKDYNFSKQSINIHWQQGYQTTKKLIDNKSSEWEEIHNEGMNIYVMDEDMARTIKV